MEYFYKYEDLMGTYIEYSTRGFRHAYFEYDEELSSKIKVNNLDIDILSDGKCCITNKNNNGKLIIKIPNELKEFLLSDSSEILTDKELCIDKKFMEDIGTKQYFEFILCSNNLNSLNIEDNDRRYFLLQVSDKYMQDNKYFGELRANIIN